MLDGLIQLILFHEQYLNQVTWFKLYNKLYNRRFNKLYITKLETPNFKLLHPDNTVIAQVRISRAAMKAAQEAAKAEKSAAKGKKK